jgi:hypothetical protein
MRQWFVIRGRATRRTQRSLRALAVAMLVLGSTTATASIRAAPSVDPETLIFGSGDWTFKLSYFGLLSGFGLSGVATGSGAGTLKVAKGVPTGAWTFDATSSVGGAKYSFSYNGSITGTPSAPILDPTQGSAMTMYIYSSTCSQVVGNFSQDAEDTATSVGFNALFDGKFFAYRTGAAGIDDYEQQAEALITEADMLAQQAEQGNVNSAQFDVVVSKAEDLSAAIKKATKCKTLNKAGDFNLVISQIIADLLVHVSNSPGAYTTGEITELLFLGVRVGAIGEGAVDQQFSDSLLAQFEANFETSLDTAIAANDQAEIQNIQVLANAMGWSDLAQKAAGAL